ncbi:MAG: hypothetical protein R3A13_11780 [Bdellovibrionota bacterium]
MHSAALGGSQQRQVFVTNGVSGNPEISLQRFRERRSAALAELSLDPDSQTFDLAKAAKVYTGWSKAPEARDLKEYVRRIQQGEISLTSEQLVSIEAFSINPPQTALYLLVKSECIELLKLPNLLPRGENLLELPLELREAFRLQIRAEVLNSTAEVLNISLDSLHKSLFWTPQQIERLLSDSDFHLQVNNLIPLLSKAPNLSVTQYAAFLDRKLADGIMQICFCENNLHLFNGKQKKSKEATRKTNKQKSPTSRAELITRLKKARGVVLVEAASDPKLEALKDLLAQQFKTPAALKSFCLVETKYSVSVARVVELASSGFPVDSRPLLETLVAPKNLKALRTRLTEIGFEPYDTPSRALKNILSKHVLDAEEIQAAVKVILSSKLVLESESQAGQSATMAGDYIRADISLDGCYTFENIPGLQEVRGRGIEEIRKARKDTLLKIAELYCDGSNLQTVSTDFFKRSPNWIYQLTYINSHGRLNCSALPEQLLQLAVSDKRFSLAELFNLVHSNNHEAFLKLLNQSLETKPTTPHTQSNIVKSEDSGLTEVPVLDETSETTDSVVVADEDLDLVDKQASDEIEEGVVEEGPEDAERTSDEAESPAGVSLPEELPEPAHVPDLTQKPEPRTIQTVSDLEVLLLESNVLNLNRKGLHELMILLGQIGATSDQTESVVGSRVIQSSQTKESSTRKVEAPEIRRVSNLLEGRRIPFDVSEIEGIEKLTNFAKLKQLRASFFKKIFDSKSIKSKTLEELSQELSVSKNVLRKPSVSFLQDIYFRFPEVTALECFALQSDQRGRTHFVRSVNGWIILENLEEELLTASKEVLSDYHSILGLENFPKDGEELVSLRRAIFYKYILNDNSSKAATLKEFAELMKMNYTSAANLFVSVVRRMGKKEPHGSIGVKYTASFASNFPNVPAPLLVAFIPEQVLSTQWPKIMQLRSEK